MSIASDISTPARVCVIGAGAAGLVALRHLTRRPGAFDVVAYEQSDRIGGMWVYSSDTSENCLNQPVHACLYEHLRTNIPKEVMSFPDFPFRDKEHSFLTHEDTLDYLEKYCAHFELRNYIQFLTKVEHVAPATPGDAKSRWYVTASRVDQPQVRTHDVYDAVVVCNGRYIEPKIPEIPGLELWSGRWIHSKNYRVPEVYVGQRVLCLGAGASGIEIASIVSSCANQIFLSHRKSEPLQGIIANIQQVPGIRSFTKDTVMLDDGRELEVDVVIFCTGFNYTFPFLDPVCDITVVNQDHVRDLYKTCLNVRYPSMSFIGLPQHVLTFLLFDAQMQYIMAMLEGRLELPSREQMLTETEKYKHEKRQSGILEDAVHVFDREEACRYMEDLARLAQVKPLPRVVENIWIHLAALRYDQPITFRDYDYKVIDDDNFEVIKIN